MIVLAIITNFFYYFGDYHRHIITLYVIICLWWLQTNKCFGLLCIFGMTQPRTKKYDVQSMYIIPRSNRTTWLYSSLERGGDVRVWLLRLEWQILIMWHCRSRYLQSCYVWACLEGLLITKLERSDHWVFYEKFLWWWSFLEDYGFCIFHGHYCDDNELYAVHGIRCAMYVLEVSSKCW